MPEKLEFAMEHEMPPHVNGVRQEAVRDDDGKAPIHLIPPEVFTALAAVYDFGAKKYAPRNWEKGMDWSRVYSSAMRHLLAFWSGEDFDEESGFPHVWHALWNCAALVCYLGTHPERDDRPKCGT